MGKGENGAGVILAPKTVEYAEAEHTATLHEVWRLTLMSANRLHVCEQCGAVSPNGQSCEEQFHDLLALEYQDPAGAGRVHHLTVLCYMLQHNRYSDEGRAFAISMLEANLEQGTTPRELRQQGRKALDSRTRDWNVTRPAAVHQRIAWLMTIANVCGGDPNNHNARVVKWAESVLATIRAQAVGVRAR